MLDIKFDQTQILTQVKENIKKKFQDEKLVLVDEVLELDQQFRDAKTKRRRPARRSATPSPSRSAA